MGNAKTLGYSPVSVIFFQPLTAQGHCVINTYIHYKYIIKSLREFWVSGSSKAAKSIKKERSHEMIPKNTHGLKPEI